MNPAKQKALLKPCTLLKLTKALLLKKCKIQLLNLFPVQFPAGKPVKAFHLKLFEMVQKTIKLIKQKLQNKQAKQNF